MKGERLKVKGEEYMKKIQLILVGIVLLVASGCNSNIYSEQLKKERKLIESYIARQGLNIVDTLPADDQWEENTYYRVPDYDNCYFHMVELGDTTFVRPGDSISRENAELESGEQVLLRFIRYTLEEYPDTRDKFFVIPNGYDKDNFVNDININCVKDDKFNMVYTGVSSESLPSSTSIPMASPAL